MLTVTNQFTQNANYLICVLIFITKKQSKQIMKLLSILTKPNILKLQLYLNRTKDIGRIERNLTLPIGDITYCTVLQYVLVLMRENEAEYEEYKRAFYILLKHIDKFEMDSNGNNALFYAAMINDNEIIRALMDYNVPVLRNKDEKLACEYVSNVLVDKYCGKLKRSRLNSTYKYKERDDGLDIANIDVNDQENDLEQPQEIENDIHTEDNIDNGDEETEAASDEDLLDDETNTKEYAANTNPHDTINCVTTNDGINEAISTSNLLDMKPNRYETDIKESKSKITMDIENTDAPTNFHSESEDNNKKNKLFVKFPADNQEVKTNFSNTIKSITEMNHLTNKEAEDILKIEYAPPVESSTESNDAHNYESFVDPTLPDLLESDSNPDYFNYSVTRLDFESLATKRYDELEPREIHIQKFPGILFIHIDNIANFISSSNDVESVAVKIICNGTDVRYTEFRKEDSTIDFSQLIKFRVRSAEINLRFFVVIKYFQTKLNRLLSSNKFRKVSEATYKITQDTIDDHHNIFSERILNLKSYKTKNLVKNFKDMFSSKLPGAKSIKTFITYISKPELPDTKMTTEKLVEFLVYRQNSIILWYKGYANVRGDCPVATHLWKRRLIEWHGYNIVIFNEFSYKSVGVFDISGCKYVARNDDVFENYVKLIGKNGILEVQLDCKERFDVISDAVKQCLDPVVY